MAGSLLCTAHACLHTYPQWQNHPVMTVIIVFCAFKETLATENGGGLEESASKSSSRSSLSLFFFIFKFFFKQASEIKLSSLKRNSFSWTLARESVLYFFIAFYVHNAAQRALQEQSNKCSKILSLIWRNTITAQLHKENTWEINSGNTFAINMNENADNL